MLIVAGILIALYIDGWIQDRQDRAAETSYLELLRDDLALMEAELQAYIDFESANVELGARTYAAIASENLPGDPVALQQMLAGLGTRQTLNLFSSAYTDLTSSGNLQLIRSQELREKIVRYFASIERAERVIEKNNSAFIDAGYIGFLLESGITPFSLASAPQGNASAKEILAEALGGVASLPDDDVLARSAGSRSWDSIRRNVLLRTRIAAIGVSVGTEVVEATRELSADIENEIAVRDRE